MKSLQDRFNFVKNNEELLVSDSLDTTQDCREHRRSSSFITSSFDTACFVSVSTGIATFWRSRVIETWRMSFAMRLSHRFHLATVRLAAPLTQRSNELNSSDCRHRIVYFRREQYSVDSTIPSFRPKRFVRLSGGCPYQHVIFSQIQVISYWT